MRSRGASVVLVTVVLASIIGLVSAADHARAAGTVPLTALDTAYTQDFDTLAGSGTANTVVPTGWDFSESGTNANTTYRAGTGSDNTGDTYSFGAAASSERAFGGLRSGTLVPLVGALFTNTTGATLTSLDISYTGEQWRLGQNTAGRAADRLDFQLSTDATGLTAGTWTDYDALDFSSPVVAGTVGALNGNVAPNRVALSLTLTGLSIPSGANFWIRWADTDLIPGADDGLAVDDFSLTPHGVVSTLHIHEVQGTAHLSPRNGELVSLSPAVVTALRTAGARGVYLQDPEPDTDPATSEGLFVFTGSTDPASLVSVGDLVQVDGRVSEFRSGPTNLTLTELVSPTFHVVSSGNPLPAPVVVGSGGLIPPLAIIEDDATGDVETSGVFDPATDGIDFYESLEGMLVQVNDAVATGPTRDFVSNREVAVVGDGGAHAGVRTGRGGVVIGPNDFNPERIILNDWIAGGPTLPTLDVGDSFPGGTLGVIDYSFGNFKLQVISLPAVQDGGLPREAAQPAGPYDLSLATFKVDNLSPSDSPARFAQFAAQIVGSLHSPDIIEVEQIEDNNGAINDGLVDAGQTWTMLIAAVVAAGGPQYDYRQIDPVDDQDGGIPGGNIRVGFLFRPDRVTFVDRPGATPTTANVVDPGPTGPRLRFNPGRIDPLNPAFSQTRKPLAGEFLFQGHTVFVIAHHANSKGGDQPLFGHFQPPVLSSEIQRMAQMQVIRSFIQTILGPAPNANVVVLGNLNDYEFSPPLAILKSTPLHALIETLPQAERYTYVFDGNSEALDHLLFSTGLYDRPFAFDIVHLNAEFASRASDTDPQVVRVGFNSPPTADADGPYIVDEGSNVTVSATGSDPENGPLSYAWDLDNDGTFETPGQSAAFAGIDGPFSQTIAVQVTDAGGLTATDTATVSISNVDPTVGQISAPPAPVPVGALVRADAPFTDPGVIDTHTAVWDWGDGSTSAGVVAESGGSGTVSGTHAYAAPGVYMLTLTVVDKDAGSGVAYFSYVVVYDPAGGFVTGGGWIASPAGAYTADPTLTGKATFGFVAKYKKGATVPDGATEFRFHAGGLDFASTSYEWLVISGSKAQFKGRGTIAGTGDYRFLLTANDGAPDTFRIKIWYEDAGGEHVVYDNGSQQALGGGSVTVHK